MIGLRPSPSGAKTAETRPQARTPHSPSYIPLFSPKATRSPPPSSSLPSSLSVPHLGLVPPNRTPSGSGPPPQSAIPLPSSSSSAHASGGTSLPSLRALRSFLPFGSGKTPSSSNGAAVPGPSKNPFANFTPGRRSSINIERKNSGQFPRSGDENDAAVIISIASPSQENPERTQGSTASADAREPSLPSPPAPDEEVGTCGGICIQLHHMAADLHPDLGPPVVTFKPDPPLSTELSTILESDLSGISKHLPALDHSQISDLSGNGHSINPEALSPPSPEISELVAPDASVLDLSTSQLKEEVMHALKEKPSTNGWLTGVVVEDAADSRPASRNDRKELEFDVGEEPEESLHLDALDSDLAALLSSNRSGVKQPIFRTENPFTSTLIPQQPQATVPPRIFPPPRTVTPQSRCSPLASSPVDASPSSTIGSSRSQPSPVRTTAPHGFSSLPRSGPSRFMPRIMRSVTDRATPVRGDRSVENVARAPSDPTLPMDDGRRVSSDSAYPRRSPASPLPFEGPPPLPSLPHSNSEPLRRVTPSRLVTPARFGAHAPASSRLLRSAFPSSSGSWGKDSPSPTSRASSALGSTVDRPSRPRTSEDGVLEGRPSARDRLGYTRNRNRSLSVGGGGNGERVTSPGPRSTEWLGPRTAKAFAAAGLLDRDVNINANNGSRFGSVRSLGDRDQRTLAPSRLAVSEAGSVASSWRSGSVSRAMTHSEATGHDSASTSTGAPRTTRSADSTAPTSMQSRTPSPQHRNYQAALQAMQEKHATETGTLLAALADAQQNAQSLRAENAKLVARIDDLEAELVDARTQLRAHMYASPSPSSTHIQPPFGRAVFSRMERQASADAVAVTTTTRRRPPLPMPVPISGHHPHGSAHRVVDLKRLEDADEEIATFQMGGGGNHGGRPSRRASWTESVFAVPPPNMSMLLQELPAGSRRSLGSVSMTTVSAPTEAPGSPGSLFLRPEHELHLGDLGGLDMRFTEDEADDED